MSEGLIARNMGELLRERAATDGTRDLLRFEGTTLTFGAVDRRTDQVAQWLATRGIGRGDRVGVMLPNGLDFPVAWLGIAKAGAVMVPLNVQYKAHDLAYTLGDAGVTLVLADPAFV
ncbi:MAG: AMP-binding protein, partial [Gemmatimonadetes bacterium]|nr:AMP-binding protein [Gemmatimonadota bacterium]